MISQVRAIDIHTHLTPQALWRVVDAGGQWHGVRRETDAQGQEWLVASDGRRSGPVGQKLRFTPEQRLADMDKVGVNVQVVSVAPTLFNYHLPAADLAQMAREVNDEIAGMIRQWPQRFSGLATLPLPNVEASIGELERAVTVLGLKGAELDTSVNGRSWDDPAFFPLFQAAERLGALLFFHPAHNLVSPRNPRYHLGNTIGNTLEDTLTVAALILGGGLRQFPALNACIAHGGGNACFGMGRIERGWQVRPEARININQPPHSYQRSLYYDCITHSEAALRFMIDQVGADRIVLGSDWPYDMGLDSPVEWVNSMTSLTPAEKEAIIGRNLERLLGL